jgi:ubiquinone biosynthesis UbiH/UbiF/VisC/COQ6 family hydroxylase
MSQMGSNVPTPQIEIVGSGPVALAAALATHQSGQKTMLRARVWQARTDDALFDARVYALNAASRALLVQLGVWSRLPAERVCAVREMRVWSAPKQSPMTFDAHDAHTDALAWIVEHNELMRALTQAVAASGIQQLSPDTATLVAPTSGALLLADGVDSALARRFGLSTTLTEYGHTAMVCTIALAASHPRGQAWQMFSPAAFPHSVLACLPLPQGQACIVWSAANDEHRALSALNDADLCKAINAAFSTAALCDAIISARQHAPLKLRQPGTIANGRVALIGDAAHAIHPMAGQGLNLGLADVATLMEVWRGTSDAGHPLRLAAYARAQRTSTLAVQALTDGLLRSFSGAWPMASVLRHGAFAGVQAFSPLKATLQRQAFGAVVAKAP